MLLTTVDTVTRLNESADHKEIQTTLVILDPGIDNLSSLLADLPDSARAVVLDPAKDGIEQITETLAAHQSVSSLHLVSHGKPGQLHLGNIALSTATLSHYESQIRQWATALKGADLLIYGCQVGEGVFGTFFLQQLQQLTGANIAASDKRVGLVNGKPNWKLSTQLGNVQTDVIFSKELQQSYASSFVEVSFDIEQDVAIETEGTLVTFRFNLDEAPPPEGTVVVLTASEPASINRFVLGGFGEQVQLNGVDNPIFFDVSPDFDFTSLAVNIRQQNASFSANLFLSPNDESLDGPGSPDIEDFADVAEEITYTISTIAPGDVPAGLGTPGTVAAGASSDTIIYADNPGQLAPPVIPELSITSDLTTLVEDEGTEVTLTISLSEPPPSDGLVVPITTGKPFALGDFDIFPPPPFASATGGALIGGFADNSGFNFRITAQTATITLPVFDDLDRTENGAVTDPDGPLRNDDIGEEQTTFSIGEGDGYTVSPTAGSVTLTIIDTNAPANTAPVAENDSFTVDEDTVLTGDVSGNDTDTEGDASYALDADAANGTVALAADGSFTYTPDADFNGTDSFTYTLSDAEFSSTATVNITVNDVVDNTAPVAENDSFTVEEDNVLTGDVSGNDTDTEGDASYALDADAANGTVALAADGSFTYTPDADFNGTDSFTYTLSDAEFSSTATVNITVNDVVDNTAPVATNDSFTVDENTVLTGDVSGNDTDTEGDASYALDADAANGTVALAADGSFTYTPDADFNGTDSFTYTLSDAEFSSTATVNITVDDVVPAIPVVSFSTTAGTLSEAAGDELVLSFAVDGEIPPVVLDDEGNYVSGGIAVNLEGDTAEILQPFLAPDGDGAVQTRVSDDGVNVFYRFDTSFGPDAGLTGGILDVFSLEDGDPAEGSSDPAAAGTGFLSNFSFILTEANASITLPVSDDIVQEADQTFSYTLVAGDGYDVDPTQNSGTFTVTDGIVPATSPTVGVTASETTLIEDEQTRTTITFTTEGDIPPEGLLVQLKSSVRAIAEFDVNASNPRNEPVTIEPGPVITGGTIVGTDEVAGSVFFRITEATSSIDIAVFDDDVAEGTENFSFSLVDGEDYEVDAANSGFDITIEDELDSGAIVGTERNDRIFATNDDDVIQALGGNDTVFGRAGDDTIDGGDGRDTLSGDDGNDTIDGGDGNDRVFGRDGNDTLEGGEGNDTVSGDDGDDIVSGGAGRDRLFGRDGDDTLDGGEGNDFVTGDNGDDTVNGGEGNDQLFGKDGNDTINGGAGNDQAFGDRGNDIIDGGAGRDRLDGRQGDDIVFGGDDNDRIFGGTGNDILSGDAGNDNIAGGSGNDILMGVTGNDRLSGGGGNDTFVFGNGDGTDRITDFSVSSDKIGLVEGELTFADLTIEQSGRRRTVIGVAGTGERLAVLDNVNASSLTESNFVTVPDVSTLEEALNLL